MIDISGVGCVEVVRDEQLPPPCTPCIHCGACFIENARYISSCIHKAYSVGFLSLETPSEAERSESLRALAQNLRGSINLTRSVQYTGFD